MTTTTKRHPPSLPATGLFDKCELSCWSLYCFVAFFAMREHGMSWWVVMWPIMTLTFVWRWYGLARDYRELDALCERILSDADELERESGGAA